MLLARVKKILPLMQENLPLDLEGTSHLNGDETFAGAFHLAPKRHAAAVVRHIEGRWGQIAVLEMSELDSGAGQLDNSPSSRSILLEAPNPGRMDQDVMFGKS